MKSQFRLRNGGTIIDMKGRESGRLKGIYRELYDPPVNLFCLCGAGFETTAILDDHKLTCTSLQPDLIRCQFCNSFVRSVGPTTYNAHMGPCQAGCTSMCEQCQCFFQEDQYQAHLPCTRPPPDREASAAPVAISKEKQAEIDATKQKVASLSARCKSGAFSVILVCSKCKKAPGCVFCGSQRTDRTSLKACDTCRENKGGGWGKVTARPNHVSAGCIVCGGTSSLTTYSMCPPCKNKYGTKCYYNFCQGL